MKKIMLLAVALLLVGCGSMKVNQFVAKPNVDIDAEDSISKLELTSEIKDTFETQGSNAVRPVTVVDWRNSLTSGFENSFNKVGAPQNGKMLQIGKADLEITPAALSAQYGTLAVAANLTFQARLIDKSGKILKRTSGTVTSKNVATSSSQITNLAKSAVESMYEKIASDLYQTK